LEGGISDADHCHRGVLVLLGFFDWSELGAEHSGLKLIARTKDALERATTDVTSDAELRERVEAIERVGDLDVFLRMRRKTNMAARLGSVSRKLVKGMPRPVVVAGPETTVRHEPEVAAR
jgi:nucleotide-binding universal stress UspA family protein